MLILTIHATFLSLVTAKRCIDVQDSDLHWWCHSFFPYGKWTGHAQCAFSQVEHWTQCVYVSWV